MSFLTLLQSQAATQTITLNRVESTAQVFLPTVILAGGTQTITLNRVESTAQVFLPTVTQVGNVQTIALNRVASTAQVFLPTIILASGIQDTSDILSRNIRRQRQEEEAVAAQLLRARQRKQTRAEKKRELIDWKQLISNTINGVSSIEQLDAMNIPVTGITSPSVTKTVLAEIEKQKELKRLELQIKQLEINARIQEEETKIAEAIAQQRQQLEAAKAAQAELLRRYQIAEAAAQKAANEAFMQAKQAEDEYQAFTQKRNNRLKRLKALMWLAKLDL